MSAFVCVVVLLLILAVRVIQTLTLEAHDRNRTSEHRKLMSQVTDATTKILASLQSTRDGISALDAKIVALSQQLAQSGTLNADDAAALQSVVDASAALAAAAAVDPTAPTPPAAA